MAGRTGCSPGLMATPPGTLLTTILITVTVTIPMSGSLADANVYRFSSKEFMTNSAMYYYGYRFYDPNLQRRINRDPIEERGGVNLYCFVSSDPIRSTDAHGLDGIDAMNDAVADVVARECLCSSMISKSMHN